MSGFDPNSASRRRSARALQAQARACGSHAIATWVKPIFSADDAEKLRDVAGFEFTGADAQNQRAAKARKAEAAERISSVTAEMVATCLNGLFFKLADFAIADAALEPATEKAQRIERASSEARKALHAISTTLENLDYSIIYFDHLDFRENMFLGGNQTIMDLLGLFNGDVTSLDMLPPKESLRLVCTWLDRIHKSTALLATEISAHRTQHKKRIDPPENHRHRPILGVHRPEEELARGLVQVWRLAFSGRAVAVSKDNRIADDSPAARWAKAVCDLAKARLADCMQPPVFLQDVISDVQANIGRRLAAAQRELNDEAKAPPKQRIGP